MERPWRFLQAYLFRKGPGSHQRIPSEIQGTPATSSARLDGRGQVDADHSAGDSETLLTFFFLGST